MALNLDSLKNLSQTSTHPNISEKDVTTPAQISTPVVSEAKPEATASAPEKAPSTGPKISLMKLKQWAAGIAEPAPKPVEIAPISDTLSVAEIEKGFSSLVSKKEEESVVEDIAPEISIQEESKEEVTSVLPEVTEAVTTVVSETQSLVIDMDEAKVQEEIVEADVTPKELFPNLQISNAMNLDEDLLDLRGIISTDKEEDILPSQEVFTESVSVDEVVLPSAPETQNDTEVIAQENETETIAISEQERGGTQVGVATDVATVVTPEYVAEVKTELSERRRAGFRFFVKNKTKIIAGMGIVFSLSVVAIFSGSFMATDVQKTGKTNIQEEIKNTKTIDTDTGMEDAPVVDVVPVTEPAGYEVGRDYSVAKNTKKNIRSKSASWSTVSTGTTTDMPTP